RVSPATNRAVEAFGYSTHDNVLLVSFQGGQIAGFRFFPTGKAPQFFQFHTALFKVFDIVSLNQLGQALVVGKTQAQIDQGADALLCVLVNANGNVLAVFPRSTAEFAGQVDIGAQSDFGLTPEAQRVTGRHALEVEQMLDRFSLKDSWLIV